MVAGSICEEGFLTNYSCLKYLAKYLFGFVLAYALICLCLNENISLYSEFGLFVHFLLNLYSGLEVHHAKTDPIS